MFCCQFFDLFCCFVFLFGGLRLRGGCDRPPVSFMGVPRWPVTPEGKTHAQPDGDSTRYLWATLSCTDLASDLVRGKCASSACPRSPGPPLISCMPHGTDVPFVKFDMGRGVRAASLAGLRQPAVPFNPRGRAHARYFHWPARLGPYCSCAATARFRSRFLRRRSRIRPRSQSAVN